jgi:hypothetical protein
MIVLSEFPWDARLKTLQNYIVIQDGQRQAVEEGKQRTERSRLRRQPRNRGKEQDIECKSVTKSKDEDLQDPL